MKGSKILFGITALLAALFWLVALAGTAGLQQLTPHGHRQFLGLAWWELVVEFFVLIWAARLHMKGIRRSRPAVLALLTYLTAILTLQTHQFFNIRDFERFRRSTAHVDRVNAACGGFLMLSLLNLVLITIFGTIDEEAELAEEGVDTVANGAYGPIA